MSRNIKKARITRISKVKADCSLEERVTVLEKQLSVMQAAMSCNINVLSSRVSDVELKAN